MVAFLSLFVDAIINGIDIPNVELYILVLKCTATNKIKYFIRNEIYLPNIHKDIYYCYN